MRSLFVALLLAAAIDTRGSDAWQPFVLRSFDGREARGDSRMLAVRENRDDPASRWIRVGVVRLRATSARPAATPIVFLSGGPGIPATTLARVPVYFDLFERLRTIGDVLLIDQRGSGMSLPNLTCPKEEMVPDALSSDERMRAVLRDRVARCTTFWRSGGVDLRGYSTREIAADVDAVRRAVGAQKMRLLAFSYGSEVAFEMLRRWPASVQRVVFASTRAPDTLLKSAAAWDQQLDAIGMLAGMPLRERVAATVSRLDREPITVAAGDARFTVGGIALLTLLRADLPDGRAIARIPSLVRAFEDGDAPAFAPRIRQSLESIAGSLNLMTLAVDCSSGWSASRLAQTRREAEQAVMRNVNLQWDPSICAATGVAGEPPPIGRIAVPALFVTGTLDPNAPVAQTDRIRAHFAGSTHLVVVNGAHETLPAAEVQSAVVRFLGGERVSGERIVLPPP